MLLQDLLEVRIIPDQSYRKNRAPHEPLNDNQTVRVYHGFNTTEDAIVALMHGISGKTRAQRIYSYEANNNPKGLFVTPDLKSAKQFGRVIIEFHANVKDLESPVWPNGTFTSQGQMSGSFSSDEEREERRLRDRDNMRNSNNDGVKDSDRPELADKMLHGGERQSLFIGDLNSNSIRAIWVSPYLLGNGSDYRQAWVRMDPKKFLEHFGKRHEKDAENRQLSYRDDARPHNKIFQPRDDFNEEKFFDHMRQKYKTIPIDEIVQIMKDNPNYVQMYFWPKQIPAVKNFLANYKSTNN